RTRGACIKNIPMSSRASSSASPSCTWRCCLARCWSTTGSRSSDFHHEVFMSGFSNKRRILLTTTAALALSAALAGCGKKEVVFQGSDISGTALGRDLDMIDDSGKPRTLDDYKG